MKCILKNKKRVKNDNQHQIRAEDLSQEDLAPRFADSGGRHKTLWWTHATLSTSQWLNSARKKAWLDYIEKECM